MIVGPRHGVALQGAKQRDKKRPDQPIQPKFSKFRNDLQYFKFYISEPYIIAMVLKSDITLF